MDIAEILKIILFGIVEGITEWLPVSSTGHLILADAFLPLQQSDAFKEMFNVVIQLGAILAVVVLFWNKLFPFQRKDKTQPVVQKSILRLWGKIIVACIPAGVVGILFDDFLEEHLHTPLVIAAMLILYGIAFLVVEDKNKNRVFRVQTTDEIDWKTALIIGAFQVLSLIPGTSRSGVTILGAILIGVARPAAAEFTFFLSVPVMFGASFIKILKFILENGGFSGAEVFALLLGSAVAFAVSLLAIGFLMSFVKKHSFKPFGWYRIALGVLVICILVLPKVLA
ncbi:MAG TPA: undecaprenyl-diphosphate phosphatase [Candidatus Scatosoma pullistercoris]|uniref:Undecaprenyl-diphosphatase n=1 Tax=Candidatus Scatosoma pullistercoris TaxID=2840934 RepID=A0A9D1SFQ7_9FIRM|nr:undecaprenyl-diphosphate phosphatase [Candidatus Scatosoma pullistercoris]